VLTFFFFITARLTNMKIFRTLTVIIFAFIIGSLSAQETAVQPELSLDKGPINNQFEFIYKKSGNYRSDGKKYEVVRTISLDKMF